MARTKLTARRWARPGQTPTWLMRRHQQRRVKRPFKIKLTLPEQKTVDIKKNGNIIKTIRIKTKPNYFSDRNARNF